MAKRRSDGVVRVPVLAPQNVSRTRVTVGPVDKGKLFAARRASGGGGGGGSELVRAAAGRSDIQTSFQDYGSSLSNPVLIPELLTGTEDFTSLSLMLRPPHERYDLYEFFWRSNPFVGRAIDLLTQLPISKLKFSKPKSVHRKLNDQIMSSFVRWSKRINLFRVVLEGQLDKNIYGDAWLFAEWDDEKKEWVKVTIIPPAMIHPIPCQFSDKTVVEFKPNSKDVELIKQVQETGKESIEEEDRRRIESVPEEIRKLIVNDKKIYLGTNPYEGSFVYQMSKNKMHHKAFGVSVIERVINPLITQERFRTTQLGLAGRNMTPKHIVSADGISPDELELLRDEVDLSFLNPEYPIVVNFPVDYQLVGAQERLLDITSENEGLENQYMAGLGVTRELIMGEGMFSGNKITVEVINTMFFTDRDQWQDYIEDHLMKPMSHARGFVEYKRDEFDLSGLDRSGVRDAGVDVPSNKFVEVVEDVIIPSVKFDRITIRDNQEVFDSLFQIYQKGSLPIDYILELFNIDPEDVNEKLVHDLFSVRDATFNDMVRDMYSSLSEHLVALAGPSIARRLAENMGVHVGAKKAEGEEEEGGLGGGRGRYGSAQNGGRKSSGRKLFRGNGSERLFRRSRATGSRKERTRGTSMMSF